MIAMVAKKRGDSYNRWFPRDSTVGIPRYVSSACNQGLTLTVAKEERNDPFFDQFPALDPSRLLCQRDSQAWRVCVSK